MVWHVVKLVKSTFYCRFVIGIFEEIRRNLIQGGLIKEELGETICKPRVGNYSTCEICGVTQICTFKVKYHAYNLHTSLNFQDAVTGALTQRFKTPLEKNPLFSIGDKVSRSYSTWRLHQHPIHFFRTTNGVYEDGIVPRFTRAIQEMTFMSSFLMCWTSLCNFFGF